MADVEKSESYPAFCSKICFVAIYAVFAKFWRFGAIYAFLRGEKLSQKWRKMTNIRYEHALVGVYFLDLRTL